jgi:hypothetical protein
MIALAAGAAQYARLRPFADHVERWFWSPAVAARTLLFAHGMQRRCWTTGLCLRSRRVLGCARLTAAMLACSSASVAEGNQESNPTVDKRAHAGVQASVTRLASKEAVFVTPHVGWVLHDRLVLGMGLSVLIEGVPVRVPETGPATLHMVVGSVRAGSVLWRHGPFELTTLASFGAGMVALDADEERLSRSSAILMLEPAAELQITPPVVSMLSFGVAGGVRVTSRFRGGYLDFGDLAGLVVGGFVRTRLY